MQQGLHVKTKVITAKAFMEKDGQPLILTSSLLLAIL